MMDIPKYDGNSDPRDHVIAYTTGVKGRDLTKSENESVLVTKFKETLTKKSTNLVFYLTYSFAKLADVFFRAHTRAQKVEKRVKDIFKIH